MTPAERSSLIKSLAVENGFDLVGITLARPIDRSDYYLQWLRAGRAGAMGYLHDHQARRMDPSTLFRGAKSIIVTACNYKVATPEKPRDTPRGRMARYAWGEDYHVVMKNRLHRLAQAIKERLAVEFRYRACVDTVPLLERELAMAAGLGWIGKNTMVLHPRLGSYFFLGELVSDLDLAPDAPMTDHCGTCRKCLDACPTQAFPAPYEMDATRCISYLTIEFRGEAPSDLANASGDWIYGCDVCQEVCPFNDKSPQTDDPAWQIRDPAPFPVVSDILQKSESEIAAMSLGRAFDRARPNMWKRNAETVLNNVGRVPPAEPL